MIGEGIYSNGSTGFDDRVGDRHAVICSRFSGLPASRPPSSDDDNRDEQQRNQDHGYYHSQYDWCVVLVCEGYKIDCFYSWKKSIKELE